MNEMNKQEQAASLAIPQRVERLPMTSYQQTISFVIILSVFFDAVDMGAMTFLLPALIKAFGLNPAMAGMLGSMSMAGMLVGSMVAGKMADRIGRKLMLQWSMIIWGVSGLLLALSWNFTSLLVFRFFLGLGLGAEYPVANAMLPEFLPKSVRGRYMTVMEGLAPIGVMCAGLVAFLVLPQVGWRWVFVAEAAPALWLFLIRRSLPESPRWLESVGRKEEAQNVITMIEQEVVKRTGQPLPPITGTEVIEKHGKASFGELWSHRYWRRTLMLCILWPASLFGYWAINVWITALLVGKGFAIIKSIQYVIWITSAGIPGFLAATYLIDKIGRKPLVICALLGSGIAAYFYGNAGSLTTLITWGLIMQFCMWNLWPSVYAYTPELYPTRLRGTGTGLCMGIGRIGAILGPYVTGLIVASTASKSMVFAVGASVFVLAAFVVLIFAPETKGRTLEEINR
jgi:putative MFS transporter